MEEKITSDAIEQGQSEAEFEENLNKMAKAAFDPLKILMGEVAPPSGKDSIEKLKTMPALYTDDYPTTHAAKIRAYQGTLGSL